jgi:hypothetical protein
MIKTLKLNNSLFYKRKLNSEMLSMIKVKATSKLRSSMKRLKKVNKN